MELSNPARMKNETIMAMEETANAIQPNFDAPLFSSSDFLLGMNIMIIAPSRGMKSVQDIKPIYDSRILLSKLF